MLICRNAEGVHGQRKFGNLWSSWMNYLHGGRISWQMTCILIIIQRLLQFNTFCNGAFFQENLCGITVFHCYYIYVHFLQHIVIDAWTSILFVKSIISLHSFYMYVYSLFLTLWRPLGFGDFRKKPRLNARGFAWEFLRSGMLYRPGKSLKRLGKSSSLHSKKIFCLGVRFFCEWRHKWRTFWPPWPTLPGPGCQPLGGSISLKFLLETRLQCVSFDTLDDLLGFRVQKLWCKLVKIFE